MGAYMSSEDAIKLLSENTEFSEEQLKVLEHKGGCCIVATAGAGKALVNGSKVLKLNNGGTFVNIEDLKPFDNIASIDGEISYVEGVFPQGKKEEHIVRFSDNTEVRCCSEHLWQVEDCIEGNSVLTTTEIMDKLSFGEEVVVPQIKTVKNYKGENVRDRLNRFLGMISGQFSIEDKTVIIKDFYGDRENLVETVRSLGMICKVNEDDSIEINNSMRSCYALNKVELKHVKRTVKEIIKTGKKVEMTCIKVSHKSGLFITDNFVVTHNTTLLTNLITKRILTGELEPDKLVATTFSLDGANEMNARLDIMFDKYGIPWAKKYAKVKTIHALCLQIMKELNLPCEVVTGLERYKLLVEALNMAGVKLDKEDIDEIDSLLGYQINRMLNDHDVVTSARYRLESVDEKTYTTIRQCYALLKKNKGVIDYEDMLFQTYYQLCASGRNDIRAYFQNKWKYFYIDEAQDTSLIQYRIMQALIMNPDNVMMIGDDDQSIYSWRGASPEVLLNVCCDYNIKKLYLSTNYRCKENVVNFSATGVKNNTLRENKQMLAHEKGGEIIFKHTKSNLYDSSVEICKMIQDLHDNQGIDYKDICVLSRYNQDLSILNCVLFNNGIYANIPKEARITYGKIFKDYVGLMDFVNGDNWFLDSSMLVLNGWKMFTYMNKSLSKIISNGLKSTGYDLVTMLECIVNDTCDDAVGRGMRNMLKYETRRDINEFIRIMAVGRSKEEQIKDLLLFYTEKAEWRFKGKHSARLLQSTYKLFRDMVQCYGFDEARKMLKNIELYEKGKIATLGSCVNLSTCHRSKGREWPVVILLADDNLSFPDLDYINTCKKNGVDISDIYSYIEEERRLHYVAKTRAKDKLILTFDKNDMSIFTTECLGYKYSNEDILYMSQFDERITKGPCGSGYKLVPDEEIEKVGVLIREKETE